LKHMHKYKLSIKTFKTIIDMEPENPWAWHQIGLNYKELEMYQKAVEAFDNALDVDPNFILGLMEKGVTLESINSTLKPWNVLMRY